MFFALELIRNLSLLTFLPAMSAALRETNPTSLFFETPSTFRSKREQHDLRALPDAADRRGCARLLSRGGDTRLQGPVPQLLQQCVAGGRRGPARRVHEVPGREMRCRTRRARVRGPPRRGAEVVDACVEKDSFLSAAVLTESNGDIPHRRHRAGVASMAWRLTR